MGHNPIAAHITNAKMGRLRTLIIGAGVAGLTLAALMRQRGEAPVVIEREKILANRGYMLGLYPIGARVLHGLGLYDRYLAGSIPIRQYNIGNGKGKLVREYSLQHMARRYGPIQGISRGALIELLCEGIDGLSIHLGTTITALSQQDQEVNVTFNDGSASRFDLVVAADGLHSDMREMVLDKDEYAYCDTGWGGWVFWADPIEAGQDSFTEYWGPGRFMGLYPVKNHLGVFVGGPVPIVKRMGRAKFSEYVQGRFERPIPVLHDTRSVSANSFFWKFHDCRSVRWHKGRVVLLGDAAVGFLPTAGVGASMAMESAAALNDELSRTNARWVEQALKLYEKRHRQRVEDAQKNSRQLGKMMFVQSQPLAWGRNQLLRFYTVERLVKAITRIMEEPI